MTSYNEIVTDSLDDIKWSIIRRYYKLTGELIDPSRITVLLSYEENSGKHGFGVLIDKQLKWTTYL